MDAAAFDLTARTGRTAPALALTPKEKRPGTVASGPGA